LSLFFLVKILAIYSNQHNNCRELLIFLREKNKDKSDVLGVAGLARAHCVDFGAAKQCEPKDSACGGVETEVSRSGAVERGAWRERGA
jgi:hypothetical protein